ncbi:hypothetical protein [Hazenella coriacea]|uniref:Uncharacterized protein n=1 Tax=Hazenella coriacea TaxID=1179467 RepID=A0A4V2UUW2_9BACL|nr:hypothetical protein [Hazenella coriacea]TCS93357.1 hypothetical protein EDD58_1073 [Hazenella coriacea]
MKTSQKVLIRTCLITAITINLMLIGLAIGSAKVPLYENIEEPVSSLLEPPSQVRTEYIMELIESQPASSTYIEEDPSGRWIVDHFKEFEYQFDQYGKVIRKTPTQKEEYIRYWEGN